MFKKGDVVTFEGFHYKETTGKVVLVGERSLLLDIGVGKGHDGVVGWTEALGFISDQRMAYWFVPKLSCAVQKRSAQFKGNK